MHFLRLQKANKITLKYLRDKSHWINWNTDTIAALRVVRKTHKQCSCWMCGNPRKYFHERTRKELQAEFSYIEQLREVGVKLWKL